MSGNDRLVLADDHHMSANDRLMLGDDPPMSATDHLMLDKDPSMSAGDRAMSANDHFLIANDRLLMVDDCGMLGNDQRMLDANRYGPPAIRRLSVPNGYKPHFLVRVKAQHLHGAAPKVVIEAMVRNGTRPGKLAAAIVDHIFIGESTAP